MLPNFGIEAEHLSEEDSQTNADYMLLRASFVGDIFLDPCFFFHALPADHAAQTQRQQSMPHRIALPPETGTLIDSTQHSVCWYGAVFIALPPETATLLDSRQHSVYYGAVFTALPPETATLLDSRQQSVYGCRATFIDFRSLTLGSTFQPNLRSSSSAANSAPSDLHLTASRPSPDLIVWDQSICNLQHVPKHGGVCYSNRLILVIRE